MLSSYCSTDLLSSLSAKKMDEEHELLKINLISRQFARRHNANRRSSNSFHRDCVHSRKYAEAVFIRPIGSVDFLPVASNNESKHPG